MLMDHQATQKFHSFGTTLIIVGSIMTFLSVVGLPFAVVYAFANSMADYIQKVSTSASTNLFNILPFYLVGTIVASIYFIVVGAKMSSDKYTVQQLRGVLIRVIVGSIFWPIVGLITIGMAIAARQDWLPEYEASNLQKSTENRDEIFSLSSQPQVAPLPSIFPKIKVFGILMAVLNLLPDTRMVSTIVMAIISNRLDNVLTNFLNPLNLTIGIVAFVAHIYATYLGFTLKKYQNDFNKLKTWSIVLGVISVFSSYWMLAIIGDIICFSSLLPQYKRELEIRAKKSAEPRAE